MPPKHKENASKMAYEAASVILADTLYLGPCSAASSASFLTSQSITHVLSIGSTPSKKVANLTYQRLGLSDSITSSLGSTLNSAIEIIDAALESNKGTGRILVHCSAGISRSPTIVTGYLMQRRGMSLKESLGCAVRARPQVSPNSGFLQQLKELELELRGESTLEVDELPRREGDRLALFHVKDL